MIVIAFFSPIVNREDHWKLNARIKPTHHNQANNSRSKLNQILESEWGLIAIAFNNEIQFVCMNWLMEQKLKTFNS
jgi:hypothetical protein